MNKEQWTRYTAAAHKIQTAIKLRFTAEYPWMDERLVDAIKHLRVGIDTSKREHASLVELLMSKGILTHDEYESAVLKGIEAEALLQEQTLSDLFPNLNIKLG